MQMHAACAWGRGGALLLADDDGGVERMRAAAAAAAAAAEEAAAAAAAAAASAQQADLGDKENLLNSDATAARAVVDHWAHRTVWSAMMCRGT
jgi:hypothetical protein